MPSSMISRRRVLKAAGLAATALVGASSFAQSSYPNGPIRLVAPFPPGGTPDFTARFLAEQLRKELGVNVVVENRVGAGGMVGTQSFVRAPADGQHLLLGTLNSQITVPLLNPKPPYDGVKDFDALGLVANYSGAILVNAALPVNNFAEFVAYAKQRPGKLNFGSAGIGTIGHLTIELIKARTGIFLVHVPYRGTADAQAAMASGDISLMVDSPISARNWMQQGKARAIAVTSAKSLPVLPNIPSLVELKVTERATPFWSGLFAPKGLPAPIAVRLREALGRITASREFVEFTVAGGSEPGRVVGEEFTKFLTQDRQLWGDLIRQQQIKAE